MTYSGVGKVVPSMATANTNASSQNATRHRVFRLLSSAAGPSSNESELRARIKSAGHRLYKGGVSDGSRTRDIQDHNLAL